MRLIFLIASCELLTLELRILKKNNRQITELLPVATFHLVNYTMQHAE